MVRTFVQWALLPVAALALLCGGARAQEPCVVPVVSYYYTPPAVKYYAPAAVSYYAPAASYYTPSVSHYAPAASYYTPAVSYYTPSVSYYAPSVSYYAPSVSYYAAPAAGAVTTTRYGLFGRPKSTTTYYYQPVYVGP